MNELRLPGQLTITRIHGDVDTICISIEDLHSHTQVLEVEVEPSEFAKAITNLASRPCTCKWRSVNRLGTRREAIEHALPIPRFNASEDELRAVMAEHEKDGWLGRLSDYQNHNNTDHAMRTRKVWFQRWVPLEEGDGKGGDANCR